MIYLDYAATAPVRPQVGACVRELLEEDLGNASSLHRAGRRARHHLEAARERIASSLGAKVEEIVFCSGATEADNLALVGTLEHQDTPHSGLITSRLEHAAVFETALRSELKGGQVHWLPALPDGLVDLEALEAELKLNPRRLVSVMATNNEVGSRQPVEQVGTLCREHGALFHCDGVQDVVVAKQLIHSGLVDLVALSGHKMGGLPGGLLFVRQGVAVNPQILGGAQEDGRRAGTSEVLRAVSLATALELHLAEDLARIRQLREAFEQPLTGIEGAVRLGPPQEERRSNHISSWLFGNLSAEPVLAQLDLRGVCASSGSACSSHSVEPSRVLKAMGLPSARALGLVRFSFGWKTTLEEVRRSAEVVQEIVEKMMQKERQKA